jgi:ABC-type lipoprotein release transport system permease subunit
LSNAFGEQASPVIYLSYRDRPAARGEIHLRTGVGAELLLAPQVERIVRDLDPSLPIYDARTLTDHVEKNLFLRRIPARMFVVLGPALLVLAAIGIYAVVAYSVSQRTTEIGVRLALGATARRVVSQIVGDSLRVVAAGAMVGWALAVAVNLHLVRGPIYLSVFGGVPLLLLTVAAVACWLPARRATEVDPIVALRQE